MFGLCSFGTYLPAYRLARQTIATATGTTSLGGERTVANFDEDTLTMGWEAVQNCGADFPAEDIKGVLFVTTTSPFGEKQAAGVLAGLLGIAPDAFTGDLTGSLRGGLSALSAARSFLKGRDPKDKVLVVASDVRLGEPGSIQEQSFGDGAAAVVLGGEDPIACVDAHWALNEDFPHFWRRQEERYVHAGDARFVENQGYLPQMAEVVRRLLETAGLTPADIHKLVVYSPDARLQQRLARALGFDPKRQLAANFFSQIGDTGTAQVYLNLAGALDEASVGQRLIVAGYGDGAEAVLLTVTKNIAGTAGSLTRWLARRRELAAYQKYLAFRDIAGSYNPFSSLALLWREQKQNLHLSGVRCLECGTIHFPRRRVCDKCGSKDRFADHRLSRYGSVYTFTNDYVYLNPDPPEILAAIDLDESGRFFGQVTDLAPGEVKIGLPVELCLRKLHHGQDLPNYFWKARPAEGRG